VIDAELTADKGHVVVASDHGVTIGRSYCPHRASAVL